MDFTRCKIWKNDLKILGSALINSIKSLFAVKIKCVSNNNKPLPLFIKHPKTPLPMPIPESKYVYYGESAHNKNVILLSYIKLPVFDKQKKCPESNLGQSFTEKVLAGRAKRECVAAYVCECV